MAPSDLLEGTTAGDEEARPTPKKPKRFQCRRCQRLFARLEHLQRHERTHTQEKPFLCDKCDSRFTRSDLLIRHERLSHNKNAPKRKFARDKADSSDDVNQSQKNEKRVRIASLRDGDSQEATSDDRSNSPNVNLSYPMPTLSMDTSFHSPLAALSFAAEQSAFQDALAASSPQTFGATPGMNSEHLEPLAQVDALPTSVNTAAPPVDPDFSETLDSLAAFLENEPLSSYRFSSTITAEQPVPFFSPESILNSTENETQNGPHPHPMFSNIDEPTSFSRFGSRLPSLQPEEQPSEQRRQPSGPKPISNISNLDRQDILSRMAEFSSIIPADFRLPSRLALSRYIGAYINGFHEHLPFLHIPTMTVENTCVELLLALAAVGAQYCFEGEKGVELFHTARAIASQRIRKRDASFAYPNSEGSLWSSTARATLGLVSEPKEDLIQTAQALLILMAMATWAKHKEILREALAIQSILATLVRDDGLSSSSPYPFDISWEEWTARESRTRTKFIVFCFFNLHCIVYNIPPLILNSELKMRLPSSAAEFKAASAAEWHEARSRRVHNNNTTTTNTTTLDFQDALRRLFSRGGRDVTELNSSLGNYILIHALIQHIFFVRQTARCRFSPTPSSLPPS
ncbi:Transcriptional regulator ADR1, partial [Lasiodiplodia theobromae]